MRWLLLLIAFAGIRTFAQQPDTVKWSENAMLTSEWPQPGGSFRSAQFVAFLDVKLTKEETGQTKYIYYTVNAQWLRNESFLADSLKPRYVPLAQLFFDCYELEARKLQDRLNGPFAYADEEVPLSNKRVNEQLDALRQITDDGFDTLEMNYWRLWMDSALQATPRHFASDVVPGHWEFGVDIGAGAAALNGTLSDYFQLLPGFSFGAGVSYNRIQFDYYALRSFAKSDVAFTSGDFKFSDSSRLQLKLSSWTIGVKCLNGYKWTVTPYGGLSAFRITNRDEPEGSLFEKGPVSVNWEAGVTTEWRFNHYFQSNAVQVFWKLRLKTGYAPVNYVYKIPGGAIKVQLGVGFTLKSVRNLPSES
ncbi:MAG TPA: hypothetical protein VK151_14040 [Fluviicola sp.]|nr:hypothetical protein [Fluviicola sp.]